MESESEGFSKSGGVTKDIVFSDNSNKSASAPESERVRVSPSGSDAETVVTPTSFSTMRKSPTDSITGVRFVIGGDGSVLPPPPPPQPVMTVIRVARGIARIFCFKAATS